MTYAPAAAIASADTAALFAPDIGAVVLSALSSLFVAVGAVATLGVLFVPWQKSVFNSGVLPGASGATYNYDHDEGRLRILDAAGSLLTIGQRDRAGVFFDVHTGLPFAREIDGAVVFNSDVTRSEEGAVARPDTLPQSRTRGNEPNLCPAPGLDRKGSEAASARAKAYQEQIAFLVNGPEGLRFGLAINLVDPETGAIVHFDECERRTGIMIDAKGPGYDQLLRFARRTIERAWLSQSLRQIRAAGKRPIVWCFAEKSAANDAQKLFAASLGGRQQIVIEVVPAVVK